GFGAGPLGRSISEFLFVGHGAAMLTVARSLTLLGEPTILIGAGILCAFWLWWLGRARVAVTLAFIVLIGRGLSEAQKYWIARVRPDVEPHLVVVKTSSFPSGHAASSMIFYLTMALALTAGRRWHRGAVVA